MQATVEINTIDVPELDERLAAQAELIERLAERVAALEVRLTAYGWED